MTELTNEKVEIECFGMTDVGQRREVNQDHFVIGELHKHLAAEHSSISLEPCHAYGNSMGKLLLVADGMGGANAGEVASELAIKSTVSFLLSSMHWLAHPTEAEVERFVNDLQQAACYSHFAVRRDAENDPTHQGMGSTLTVAYVTWPMMYVLHIGDSRCYLRQQDKLHLLTKDQTFAQHLYDEGHLNHEQFERSNYHHVLVSAIGAEGEPDAIVYRQRLSYGDRILLCSDGVNLHLTDDEIDRELAKDVSSKAVCESLIGAANRAGGRDNITAVVAKFLEPTS